MHIRELIPKLRRLILDPKFDYLIIAVLIIIITSLNLIWVNIETRPPHWDMARHLWNSLQYFETARSHQLYALLANYWYYPPLVYLVALPFYGLLGVSIPAAVASNVVFLTVAAFSMYGIGKQLWGRQTGLLATLFLLCSPMLASQFKEFQVDAPLTAIVCLVIYLLIRTHEFLSTKYSLLLGLALGLGMLTKWTFGFIIAAPLGFALLSATVLAYREKSWSRVVNGLLCGLVTYATASIWYITNKHQLLIDITQNGAGAGVREGDPVVGSLASNVWYAWNLLAHQLYLIPTLFLVIGIVYLFIKRQGWWTNRYPLLLAVGTLLFFTLLRNKDPRYTLPALIGLSILATYWITYLKKPLVRRVASLGLTLYLAITFYALSFGLPLLPRQVQVGSGQFPLVLYSQTGYIIGKPTHENWQLEAVFKQASLRPVGHRKIYYEGADTMWLNSWDLSYYADRYDCQLTSDIQQADVVMIRTEKGLPSAEPPEAFSNSRTILPDGSALYYGESD